MTTPSIPSVNDDIAEKCGPLNAFFPCVGFAAFTILIWDHIDTFTTEVEYIWKRKKGLLVYLFLLNRYLTPLGFIVNLFAYLAPVWTDEVRAYRYVVVPTQYAASGKTFGLALLLLGTILRCRCRDFIRFEGAMTLIGIHVVGIMMLLRIHAIYSANRPIVGFVAFLLLVSFSINAWLLSRGEHVIHNPQSKVIACTMIFPPEISAIASSSAWLPLLYDSVVFFLTLKKTIPLVRNSSATYMVKRILEDGLIYYAAIFCVTLVLTLMIIFAPPGSCPVANSYMLPHLLTLRTEKYCRSVTMMSRITLNLKKCADKRLQSTVLRDPGTLVFQTVLPTNTTHTFSGSGARTIGDW
ncbi:hypothetical protein R3P38DRAFT_2866841 [Favolaschia claudopus]|uniref:DUF6533 domain-containing protein n=1 Tax=Favolaschia claudopus TaxID=2862362 RepID=A0AAW0D563_9AGAR